jgi:hypothetical protein
MLNDSAKAVRDAVKSRVEAGRDMNLHYEHAILLLQHILWHEGLPSRTDEAVAGRPMTEEEAGHVGRLDAQEVSWSMRRAGYITS